MEEFRGAFEIDDLAGLVEQVRFCEARTEVACVEGARSPSSRCIVKECIRAGIGETADPEMDCRPGNLDPCGDIRGGHSFEPEQNDTAAADNPLRGRRGANPALEALSVRNTHLDIDQTSSTESQFCNADPCRIPGKNAKSLPGLTKGS